MYKAAAIIACFLTALLSGAATAAETGPERRCEQRGAVLAFLSHRYSEKPVAMGLAENGGLIEVLASHDGQTFTIIVTSPEGRTCMVAAGEDWQAIARHLSPHT